MCSPRGSLPVELARGQLSPGVQWDPLCMEQYSRIFSCYRRPGPKQDTLLDHKTSARAQSEYIIVACKNQVRHIN